MSAPPSLEFVTPRQLTNLRVQRGDSILLRSAPQQVQNVICRQIGGEL